MTSRVVPLLDFVHAATPKFRRPSHLALVADLLAILADTIVPRTPAMPTAPITAVDATVAQSMTLG